MATAFVDGWTEEKCLELIKEFRRKPILWDKQNRYFFRRNMKTIAWEEIGNAMKISPDQCKHKMIVLMSSFRREKARLVNSLKNLTSDRRTDSYRLYRSTWFAFDEMAFLLDKDSERKRQQNEDSDEIDENGGDTSTLNLSLIHQRLEHLHPAKKARVMSNNNETEVKEPDILQPQVEAGPSQTPSERDEEIVSFTTFIASKMKKYSDTTKNAVQQAMCDIIFKADQNYYENNCYDKFTIIDAEADPLLKKETFEEYVEHKPIIKINDSDSD